MDFDELMNCYFISGTDNNRIVYDELVQLIKENNITPFIGAGLSKWATYPLWGEMLREQAENYGLESEMEPLLKENDYEAAATLLEDELGSNGLINLLRRIFRTSLLEEKTAELPGYLRDIPKLFCRPIVTTNFDHAIEHLFWLEGKKSPDTVTPSNDLGDEQVNYALHNSRPILIKMHGDIEKPTTLVLTKESYDKVYGENAAEPDFQSSVAFLLQKISERNPLLFLGCSLNNDRTCEVIKKCTKGLRQFAFMELPEETQNTENAWEPLLRGESKKLKKGLRERNKYLVDNLNIQPIWYPYSMHEEAYTAFFQQLCQDLGIDSSNFVFNLKSKMPEIKSVVHGRDTLIEEIHGILHNGKHALFLQGIGGIGKSEAAKWYAQKYEKEYKHILYLTYTSSLEELVCNPKMVEIKNFQQFSGENREDFFKRKVELLKTNTDERTLFIIDNFDVDTDPHLDEFLQGNYHVILTTRNSHPAYSTIHVGAMKDFNIALKIFTKNYGKEVVYPDDLGCLKVILTMIYYHTYMIELIARQMAASNWNPQKMLEVLTKWNFSASSDELSEAKNQETAVAHLRDLFEISQLNEEDKKIMMYLSLVGERGILASRFQEWAGLSGTEVMETLRNRAWIFHENGERFSLHPLVTEIIHTQLSPSVEYCQEFLDKVAEFCYRAWYRNYQENMDVVDNVIKILQYFTPSFGDDVHNFSILSSFLWQIGRFDESIFYETKVYDACLQKYGEASIATGYIARDLGGCYFNSDQLKESVKWYNEGLRCMKLACEGDNEDLALCYEKVARCHTWGEKLNLEKAEEYFQIALDMRMRLLDALANGEKKAIFIKYEDYNYNFAQERIGESYMEMGRMYQITGKYETALDYAKKDEKILLKYKPENISGLAYAYFDQGVCYYHLGMQAKEAGHEDAAIENWRLAAEKLKEALKRNMEMRGGLAIDTIDNQEYLADTYQRISEEVGLMASNGYAKANSMAKELMGENNFRSKALGLKLQNSRAV